MKVDGTVLLGRMAKAVLLSGPERTAYRASRRIDELAVMPLRSGVDDSVGVHLQREVPGADAGVASRIG